jgi:hypothetical protein
LTTDPNGSVLTINLNANGTTFALTFPQSPTNNTPAASATPTTSAAPEPSSIVLLVSALPAGLLTLRRWRQFSPVRGVTCPCTRWQE